jgi:glycosyltransferase involved in cell wall biosynthesis
MSGPSVTVLLCTFNDEQTVSYALGSALAQTAAPSSYRVVVVDDGSTDATPRILEACRERIDLIKLPRNRGLAAACNEGLRAIRTPWFVRLDGDDRFEPDLLRSLLEHQRASSADVVSTDRWEQGPNGRRVLRRLGDPPNLTQLIAAGALLSTGLVLEVGGYEELFWEEIDLYLRLFESGRCRTEHVARPLYTYSVGRHGRMTSDQRMTSVGWGQLRSKWPANVLERHGVASSTE